MAITGLTKIGTATPFGKDPGPGVQKFQMDLDASYPAAVPGTGGYTTFSTSLKTVAGLEHITVIDVLSSPVTDGANNWLIPRYDRANDRLQFLVASSGIEVANGVSLAAYANIELTVIYI